MLKPRFPTSSLFVFLVLAAGLTSCNRTKERVFSGTAFSTAYEVRVVASPTRFKSADLDAWIADAFRQAEAIANNQNPESEISKFNRSERFTWLPASRGLVTLVTEGIELAKLTNGAFDPTAGRLTELYRKSRTAPGPNAIAAAKTRVGHFYLEARQDPLALKKSRGGLYVDLTPLAPAFAVDEVSDTLRKKGLDRFQVRLGRIARSLGTNSSGAPWPYSVARPSAHGDSTHLVQEPIALENRSAATATLPDASESNPVLLIDPRSGKPVETDLFSVSVAELSAMRSAGRATAFFLLGKKEGMELAKKMGSAAYFVSQGQDQGLAEATASFPSITTTR